MASLDVLVDLDDTLVYDHKTGKADFENICTLNYSLFLGGRELLSLLQQLELGITIHSQGSKARNSALVSAIANKFFTDKGLKYRLFSSDNEAVRRKRLGGLFEGIDLDRAIMLDDLSHLFAIQGEERNFLQVIPNLVRGAELDPGMKKHYQVVCANRLVRAMGMILWSLHLSRTTRLSPVDALSAMQWYGGSGYRHWQTHSRSVYELGVRAMRRVSPGMDMNLDGGLEPWKFPFDKALGDNKFEPQQVQAMKARLPCLTKEEEQLLIPPLDFDPDVLFT